MNKYTQATSCVCSRIRTAESFSGWKDYNDFKKSIQTNEVFLETAVKENYSNVGLEENWYQCLKCKQIWRLVAPDPPFYGLWAPIKKLLIPI
nr:hypothetical protein [uncultured Duganella sp.]